MGALPGAVGWATDLAVLELTGSVVEDRDDHLVVRSPHQPNFHWGNLVVVLDEAAVADADRWVRTFHAAHPDADWVLVGLPALPSDVGAWARRGITLEVEDVLSTRTLPATTPLPPGYTVRRFTDADWELDLARSVADNALRDEHDPASYERFARGQERTRRDLSAREVGAWFGAFAGETMVADLGIVRCGRLARYQDVSTDPDHRGRGLASHLLGVAARWAAEGGCEEWVIVTEATNPAGRVYRRSGFSPDTQFVAAYRLPPRAD